jgi:flagellar motor switch protein FliM
MTGQSKVHHRVPVESLTRLKANKLGRHYHRVPQYIREISAKYPWIIGDYFLRNYRINLELTKSVVHEHFERPAECIYQAPLGKVGFTIERHLLSEALESYYGGVGPRNQEEPPVSSSEQRMRGRLGGDIIQLFARALLSGETFGRLSQHDNSYEDVQWEYVAEFQFANHITGKSASLYIYLDNPLVDELTSRLSSPLPSRPIGNPTNHIKHLPVRLDCVLASLQMPLTQVLGLREGDILMTRLLERCEVQINQQKLFRGSLFEEDGCLYLTSLESLKQS